MPAGEVLDIPVDEDHVREQIGLLLASMPWENRLAVRIALLAFDWLAVLRFGRPFSSLKGPAQHRWLDSWVESRLSLVRLWARLLLTLVKPTHIARRAVQARMGVPPERLARAVPDKPLRYPEAQVIRQLEADREIRCQVVVVGSGAGGAVVAAELAERGIDVVLVEEGRIHDTGALGRDPGRSLREAYRAGATTIALGIPAIPIPLGMTVGGSTTINSGTCFRTPPWVLDRWQSEGLSLDRQALDRHFSRVEERISVTELTPELLGGSSDIIATGAEALGLAHGPLRRNIRGCHRSAVCAFGCPRDAKQSMNVTYVPRALAAGATLYTGLRASKVIREGGRARGIIARPRGGGPTLRVRADAVVSSCGSIPGVPFLKAAGLRSKHLGRHLTIHPAAKIVALMPEPVDGWNDTPQGYAITAFQEEGLMFEGAFVPPEYTSIALPFVGPRFTEVMEDFRRLAVFGLMVSDKPRGRVFRGLDGRPIITYQIDREDVATIQRGLGVLAEVFFAAGAERIFLPIAGREEQPSLEATRQALATPIDPIGLELVAFHPLGTARMSHQATGGVVGPDLQCWELPDLYVIDGSIFPSSLGVNPQLSIMAFASMAAERLAARFGG